MIRQTILSLILTTMLLTCCTPSDQDDPQASPSDVVTETQAEKEETATQDALQEFPS